VRAETSTWCLSLQAFGLATTTGSTRLSVALQGNIF
jgi:hypothetical protein